MNSSMENIKRDRVQKMFNSIAGSYDFLNHALSMGVDYYWRHKALKLVGMKPEAKVLDVACGTGDFSIAARRTGIKDIYGCDLSGNMLSIYRAKDPQMDGRLIETVAERFPFKDSIFDNIIVAFGVRNFHNIPKALLEFRRVLKPGGVSCILEFSMPKNRIFSALYSFYFKRILPLAGKAVSGDTEAYSYLPQSVEEFDREVNLELLLKNAGFASVKKYSLSFGIVQILLASA